MQLHLTSPSGLETFDLCPKKWFADKVLKIPEPPKDFLAFGTALHAVCERFLLADDLGRVPDFTSASQIVKVTEPGVIRIIESGALIGQRCGDPVNLYPEDWHIVKERDGGTVVLTNEQQNLIRILIDKAFEEGKIARWPGRKVERRFGFPEQPPVTLLVENGWTINVCGVIDVDLPDSVRDWKTAKNMRYAKSAKQLLDNMQMGIYSGVKIIDAVKAGGAVPDHIDVYHTVFSKDPAQQVIRETKATMLREHIDNVWRRAQLIARRMIQVLNRNSFEHAGEPSEGACGAYGGCSMLPVCNGCTTLENHRQQMELVLRMHAGQGSAPQLQQTTPALTTPTLRRNPMGILSQGTGATPPSAPPGIPPAAAAPVSLNPPAVAQMPPGNAAPWAFPGCTACSTGPHPGLNTQGEPCRICDGNQAQARGITSGMYQVLPDGQGGITYQVRPEYQAAIQGLGAPLSGVVHKMAPNATVQTLEAPAQPQAATAAPVAQQPQPTSAPGFPMPMQPQPQPGPTSAPTFPAPAPQQPIAQPQPTQTTGTTQVAGFVHTSAPVEQPEAKDSPDNGKAKAFVLYINTTSTKFATSRKVVDLNQLFGKYAEMLVSARKAESYYKLDVWERRDAMAASIGYIIDKEFPANALAVGVASDPEVTSFISALRPLATEVIEAKVV